jgi:hypothetical protein
VKLRISGDVQRLLESFGIGQVGQRERDGDRKGSLGVERTVIDCRGLAKRCNRAETERGNDH